MGRRRRGRAVHGILLVDKPTGASSNAVLQRVRRQLEAAKAGHAGTLDPLATGMLPVMFGEATKFANFLISSHKAYEATLCLGVETDSLDADGEVTRTRDVPSLTQTDIEAAAVALTGDLQQVPPMVSAIKVNGERLYKAAREGREVERKARTVTVHSFEILGVELPQVRIRVHCSKGTYIRVLGADLGEALGCGAHVTALRRCWVSPFEDAAMYTPQQIEQHGESLLLPLDAGLGHLGRVNLDASGVARFRHGQPAQAGIDGQGDKSGELALQGEAAGVAPGAGTGSGTGPDESGSQPVRVYGPDQGLIGLGIPTAGPDRLIQPLRVLQLGDPITGEAAAN